MVNGRYRLTADGRFADGERLLTSVFIDFYKSSCLNGFDKVFSGAAFF